MKGNSAGGNRPANSMKIRRVALTAILFSLALVLSLAEAALPLPVPVPGVRFGLSNIIVMYSAFFLRGRDAALLVLLKGVFVLATRGVAAGFLSFCGGSLSLLVILLLAAIFRDRISLFGVSVSGAICHNIGQFFAVYALYRVWLIPYLPLLIVSGILAGFVTSALLKAVLPMLQKLRLK